MSPSSVPEELQRRLAAEWAPVRPLASPRHRTLVVAALSSVVAAAALVGFELRSDLGAIPSWLSWGCSLLELGFGVVLVGMALRESIPGDRLPAGVVAAMVVGGVAVQALIGVATWLGAPATSTDSDFMAHGVGCLAHDSLMGLPTFVITMWLILRALPMRASMVGIIGGAGAGLTADAIVHLQCPVSDLRHVLVWHTGALLLLMLAGWGVGKAWDAFRSSG